MNWRVYEEKIFQHLQGQFPEYEIIFDQKVKGRFSGTDRQIDILLLGKMLDYPIRGVVDCKCFSKKVDVKTVDQFIGYMSDAEAHIGILITNSGYTEAAHKRAKNDPLSVHLEVISFEKLKQWKFDQMALVVPATFAKLCETKSDSQIQEPKLPYELLRYFDVKTPFYKSMLEELSSKSRAIFDLLSTEPYQRTAEDIANTIKAPISSVLSYLAALQEGGHISKTSNIYFIQNPMFAMWNICRHSRNQQLISSLQQYLIWLSEIKGYKIPIHMVGNNKILHNNKIHPTSFVGG